MTQRDAAKKHGVSAGTVAKWAIESGTEQNEAGNEQTGSLPLVGIEARKMEFALSLIDFLDSAVAMAKKWTVICQDEKFVKSKPMGANELGRTALDFADRIVARTSSQGGASQTKPD